MKILVSYPWRCGTPLTVEQAVVEAIHFRSHYDSTTNLQLKVDALTELVGALVDQLPNAQQKLDVLNAVEQGWTEV